MRSDCIQEGEVIVARNAEEMIDTYLSRSVETVGTPDELIDLRDLKFEPSVAPPEATVWNGRSPRGQVLTRGGR
jgi:hypothetical protein